MINAQMKMYDYYTLGQLDEYGQRTFPTTPSGKVKMAINLLSQNTEENILYNSASYVGLTRDKGVSDKFIIDYLDPDTNQVIKLKVLYCNPIGKMKQIFMGILK